MNIIGVDVGGTKIFAGRYNADLDLEDLHKLKTEANEGREQILQNLLEAIANVRDENTKAIGIAWAGFVNPETGTIVQANNIPALNEFELCKFVTEKTELPCWLENDARCFALGEYQAAKPKPKVCLGLILGTGAGGGLITDGAVFRGSQALAGEVGHMVINGQTVESQIAGPALHDYFDSNRLSEIQNISIEKLQPKLEILTTWLQNLIFAYDPDLIVIGGGAGRYFWQQHEVLIIQNLQQKMKNYAYKFGVKFSNRKNAGAEGAALIALENLS